MAAKVSYCNLSEFFFQALRCFAHISMWRNACASISHICPPLTRSSQLLANFVEIFRQISWKYPGKYTACKYSENMPACATIGHILSKRSKGSKKCGEEISTGVETGSGGSWDLFVKCANANTEQLFGPRVIGTLSSRLREIETQCHHSIGWSGPVWHGVT